MSRLYIYFYRLRKWKPWRFIRWKHVSWWTSILPMTKAMLKLKWVWKGYVFSIH